MRTLILLIIFSTHVSANQKLMDAVKTQDITLVRSILNSDQTVDMDFQEGTFSDPVLLVAARSGRTDIVELLLDYGSTISMNQYGQNYRGQGYNIFHGDTALVAAKYNYDEMLELLIAIDLEIQDSDVFVNDDDRWNNTALIWTIYNNNNNNAIVNRSRC